MKVLLPRLLALSLLVLNGCGGTGMVSLTPDTGTGQMLRKTYTKYYDAGVWLAPGHLGLSVVVDQLNEHSGKITIYAWNRDKTNHAIEIQAATSGRTKAAVGPAWLQAVGGERSGLEAGTIEVSNYSTFIDLDVYYRLDGVAGKASLHLERRTPEELDRYFGRNGKAPYPWFYDQQSRLVPTSKWPRMVSVPCRMSKLTHALPASGLRLVRCHS